MSTKTLYQQAVEIYLSQQTLNFYVEKQEDTWYQWYNALEPTEKWYLVRVATIVEQFVEEITSTLSSEILLQEGFVAEIASKIHRKHIPLSFLQAIGVTGSITNEKDESLSGDILRDTFTGMPPSDDGVELESKNVLEIAFDELSRRSLKGFSLQQWFADLSVEDQEVLKDATETILGLLPEIFYRYVTVYLTVFQQLNQDVRDDLEAIQQLWKYQQR